MWYNIYKERGEGMDILETIKIIVQIIAYSAIGVCTG